MLTVKSKDKYSYLYVFCCFNNWLVSDLKKMLKLFDSVCLQYVTVSLLMWLISKLDVSNK